MASHTVWQLNGPGSFIELRGAEFQLVDDTWPFHSGANTATPSLLFLPDASPDACLLMKVDLWHPARGRRAALATSDSNGVNWSQPRWVHTDESGLPDAEGAGLCYLRDGKVFMNAVWPKKDNKEF